MKISYFLLVFIALVAGPLYSQNPVTSGDHLLSEFVTETDLVKKEQLLNQITRQPDVGHKLLRIATQTSDIVTKWMSIRGIGFMKYGKAVPFLTESLGHKHPHVRANAARALGEMRAQSASYRLIDLLHRENDGGVIEQTSLALRMLGAKNAVPALERVAQHPSSQTRCWVLQAIGSLGAKRDIPFLAKYLYDSNDSVDMCAAQAIEEITGEDFGFPKQSGPMSPQQGIESARQWWEAKKTRFGNNE